jgi:hypothetical protein
MLRAAPESMLIIAAIRDATSRCFAIDVLRHSISGVILQQFNSPPRHDYCHDTALRASCSARQQYLILKALTLMPHDFTGFEHAA